MKRMDKKEVNLSISKHLEDEQITIDEDHKEVIKTCNQLGYDISSKDTGWFVSNVI